MKRGQRDGSRHLGELPSKNTMLICILLALSDRTAFLVPSLTDGECWWADLNLHLRQFRSAGMK